MGATAFLTEFFLNLRFFHLQDPDLSGLLSLRVTNFKGNMQKEVYIGEGTLLIIFAVTKLLIRSNVKKRDYFGTVFESIVYHGKKITMAGHIVLSVRNQRAMNTCTQFTFSFYSV